MKDLFRKLFGDEATPASNSASHHHAGRLRSQYATPEKPPAEASGLSVEETATVILRRQIPVRFDEAPRSWLGGAPMMPESVPWPVAVSPEFAELGPLPLHFVAQIACADLPEELWGGLGPRHGWLLFFLDARNPGIEETPGAVQVIHIDELGPERTAPADLPPVRDESYTGYDYRFLAPGDDLPASWRRWPVDIVTFPNDLEPDLPGYDPDDEISIAPPRMSAQALYPDTEISSNALPPPFDMTKEPPTEEDWPFTWGGALYVVNAVMRAVATRRPMELQDRQRAQFEDADWPDRQIPQLQATMKDHARNLAAWEEKIASAEDAHERGKANVAANFWRAQLAGCETSLRLFESHRGAEGLRMLLKRVEDSQLAANAWWAERMSDLDALRAGILTHDLDGPMSADDFRPIFTRLAETRVEWLGVGYDSGSDGNIVQSHRLSLLDLARHGFRSARFEAAGDLYVTSPETAARIPDRVRAQYEPIWRHVQRPHRMGGWHDGIQTEATAQPKDEVLLFQIASDYPMQWCWGDAGAHYVFIKTADLKAGRFDRPRYWFEN